MKEALESCKVGDVRGQDRETQCNRTATIKGRRSSETELFITFYVSYEIQKPLVLESQTSIS